MYWSRGSELLLAGALLFWAGAAVGADGQAGETANTARAASSRASTAQTQPRIFLHDPASLVSRKVAWHADSKSEPVVADLLAEAGRALGEEPFSIVDKDVVPPSGDKHDYLSLAPYAWPDPRKPNGLPYLIRDGELNPERDRIPDHRKLTHICSVTETLGLAYYFSDDDKYVAKAAALLRRFFIAPTTRMNPNLSFAQGIRGKQDGRAAGIIDGACIARLVDGVGLLASGESWSKPDREGLDAWFRAYLTWLRESDLGRKEGRAGNNHGTWYDVQVVSLALATGQVELAIETLNFARKRRIGRQIEPDGEQPEELRRTRPWHYAVYNLQGMVLLAGLGERVGVDLWHYQTSDGRSLRKAIAWILSAQAPPASGPAGASPARPATMRPRPEDLEQVDAAELWPVLRVAASALKDGELAAAADRLAAKAGPVRDHHLALFYD